MKPKDIKRGQKYINPGYPNTIYLGIFDHYSSNYILKVKKNLVIIESPYKYLIGVVVARPDNFNAHFWNDFKLI